MSRHTDVLDLLARARPPELDIPERRGDLVSRIVTDEAHRARPRRNRLRRRLVLASSVAAVAVVVAATTAIRTNGTPAYAVTTGPDGTITVTVNRVADPGAANRALRQLDERVFIIQPSAPDDCPVADRGVLLDAEFDTARPISEAIRTPANENPVRIGRASIPKDAVLVLIPLEGMTFARTFYAAPGPTCVVDSFPPATR
ncbi:hypothetical protein AB0J74_27005 [Asanoa sp. NPDC049573]|uniref:hypothetical protein n=1 Tax=Asanoa sp. NPDC049573 TaxID=3155396 RepID=UPI00343366BD